MENRLSGWHEKCLFIIVALGYAGLCLSIFRDMVTESGIYFPLLTVVLLVTAGAVHLSYQRWISIGSRRPS